MNHSRYILVLAIVGVLVAISVFGYRFFVVPSRQIAQVHTGDGPRGLQESISETDGVRHSVPLNEILAGGPPQDGIPPIDDPQFIAVSEANDFLNDDEPGIVVERDGDARFYPYQILVWHEIVNDTFDDQRVLVTYCPLCFSGVVFDPIVDGERVEFGTSGKLWNSNLVMYDRKTESYWSQVLGEAIVGPKTGESLSILPSELMQYGLFKKTYSNGTVLSKDTGSLRAYGTDPYGDYYTTEGVFFPVNNEDDRLAQKDLVLGVVVNGQAKAYLVEAVQEAGTVRDTVAGETIIAEYKEETDTVQLFTETADGQRERVNPLPTFWFAWVAAYPETELFN